MAALTFGLRVSGICKKLNGRKVRSYVTCGLTFFVLFLLIRCEHPSEKGAVSIIWKDNKAVAIALPDRLAGNEGNISVRVKAGYNEEVTILGEVEKRADSLIFTPMIPFTRGLVYEVFDQKELIESFSVPKANAEDAPRVVAIYPSQDTVPENLLKIYLQFSQPMQEGRSSEYIMLVNGGSDTIKGAFLDLQPELWNENRTQLTLWLDPGRIKRDLLPNQKLGTPMQKNRGYRIMISDEWKSTQGSPLGKAYSKTFVTTSRDSVSPNPRNWKIVSPRAETVSALQIDFYESLDHGLLDEAFTVSNEKGMSVAGQWNFIQEEAKALFVPKEKWLAGQYHLKVDTRLEDLASNNINRPFDREITKTGTPVDQEDFVLIDFRIGPL
jgi:hypothetical protein